MTTFWKIEATVLLVSVLVALFGAILDDGEGSLGMGMKLWAAMLITLASVAAVVGLVIMVWQ